MAQRQFKLWLMIVDALTPWIAIPTAGSNVDVFGQRIANNTGKFSATGMLSFLNTWTYQLGAEILVPRGRQELYNRGVLHDYQCAQLYNPFSKIIARTTPQNRMLKVGRLIHCMVRK